MKYEELKIDFGTETGTSERMASDFHELCKQRSIDSELVDLSEYSIDHLKSWKNLVVFVSTWGEGDPPGDIEDFYCDLEDLEEGELSSLSFSIIALGDSAYEEFCGCGRKMQEFFEKAGAKAFLPRVELDADDGDESSFESWKDDFFAVAI